jgi:CheY-like chemotaxis protein
VLANLLNNAARYSDTGGRIALSAAVADGAVEIAIVDDGPGIPEDLAVRLFEPFSQGPRTLDRQQGGLGLGLALARRLVELHGGSLVLDQTHRPGARFVIRLAPASRAAARTAVEAGQPRRATTARHVLLVDDNVDAAEMLQAGLEQAGYSVAVAADAPSALDVAARQPPDAAVLDIGLPGIDGYELARRLRRAHPGVRLVALTGYGQPADTEAAAQAGFDAHCTKPVALAVLLDCIDVPTPPIS